MPTDCGEESCLLPEGSERVFDTCRSTAHAYHSVRFDEIFTAEDLYEILSENSASPQRIRPDETPRLDDQLRIARVQGMASATCVCKLS